MTTRRWTPIKPGVAAPGMAERLGVTVDERRGVEYHRLRSKDLLNKFNGRPMPFGWTVNPYRGCEMACRYCFARYTHEFLGLNDRAAFERRIYVKDADRDRLVAELRRAQRSGQSVAIGTATDPYQPAEGRFEVTRRVLEAARMVPGLALSITTKSTLVSRDAALRRASAASAFWMAARRRSSISISRLASPGSPRRASPRSKASGLSRIHLISCMPRSFAVMPRASGASSKRRRLL